MQWSVLALMSVLRDSTEHRSIDRATSAPNGTQARDTSRPPQPEGCSCCCCCRSGKSGNWCLRFHARVSRYPTLNMKCSFEFVISMQAACERRVSSGCVGYLSLSLSRLVKPSVNAPVDADTLLSRSFALASRSLWLLHLRFQIMKAN